MKKLIIIIIFLLSTSGCSSSNEVNSKIIEIPSVYSEKRYDEVLEISNINFQKKDEGNLFTATVKNIIKSPLKTTLRVKLLNENLEYKATLDIELKLFIDEEIEISELVDGDFNIEQFEIVIMSKSN